MREILRRDRRCDGSHARMSAVDATSSRQRWELENEIESLNANDSDDLYKWDAEEQREIQNSRPWTQDAHYFKK